MPGWGVCSGWCERIGSVKVIPRGDKELASRYYGGARYCRGCERYFTADILERMRKGIFCPCCRRKTSGRARHGNYNMKVKMEKLLVVSK